MPDKPRKPLAKLDPKVPKDVREFVRCRSDSLEIAPRTLDILGMSFDISFEDGANGSVVVRLDGPGPLDIKISVSIQDGHLAADTSKLPFGKEAVDKWIKDFNADLESPPAKRLTGISASGGKFKSTKGKVVTKPETTGTAITPPPMAVPPLPDHVVDPIPPPVRVGIEETVTTTAESVPDLTDLGTDATPEFDPDADESGFIDRPKISEEASRFTGFKAKVVGGVVSLGVIAFFLFGNLGGDPPDATTAGSVETTQSTAPPTTAQTQSSEETPVTEDPVGVSVVGTDPVGDNGGAGSGGDLVSLRYVDDGVPTVFLGMADSPLESTESWYSYYLEVTFKRESGAVQVVIWEKHAGLTRSGTLDETGDSDGLGATLTDELAEFQADSKPDDPVVTICVKAFSLVTSDGVFTQDEMEVAVGG
jgi:hypothetical protein